jgi:hypothetical protein
MNYTSLIIFLIVLLFNIYFILAYSWKNYIKVYKYLNTTVLDYRISVPILLILYNIWGIYNLIKFIK